jgi:multiple antibiotic resistance protein
MTESKRSAVVRQSILTALAVSMVFVALGEAVFRILGITVNDFKIAGGLILLVIAILAAIAVMMIRLGLEGIIKIGL